MDIHVTDYSLRGKQQEKNRNNRDFPLHSSDHRIPFVSSFFLPGRIRCQHVCTAIISDALTVRFSHYGFFSSAGLGGRYEENKEFLPYPNLSITQKAFAPDFWLERDCFSQSFYCLNLQVGSWDLATFKSSWELYRREKQKTHSGTCHSSRFDFPLQSACYYLLFRVLG